MPRKIEFNTAGSPTVLQAVTFDRPRLGPGEVWLEQAAIGVNYLDVTQRNGAIPIPLPGGLGLEAAGVVAEIGEGVENVKVGDRVVYALGPIGAYADARVYPAERLIKLPDDLSFADAAAVFFKGLTAQYLIKSTYPVTRGTTILLYGAAGALGQILAGWANSIGARVIGVVSSSESIERARKAGSAEVLIWNDELPRAVHELTGRGVDVVYDGVGKMTFAASLDSLRPRGTMVSIGASSGAPDPVSPGLLNAKGSLFLTRPGLAAHIGDIDEYRERAADLFAAVSLASITPRIWKSYPLADVASAHADIESRRAQGAIVLATR